MGVFSQQMLISIQDIIYRRKFHHMDANLTVSKLLGDTNEQRKGTGFKSNDMYQGKTSQISLPHKGAVPSELHLTTPNYSGVKPPLQSNGFY